MSRPVRGGPAPQRWPLAAISAATAGYSLVPLVVHLAGPGASVWMFAAAMEFWSSVLLCIAVAVSARVVFGAAGPGPLRWLPARVGSGPHPVAVLALLVCTSVNMAWYLLAARFVPLVTAVAVAEGLYPVVLAVLLSRWGRSDGRFLSRRNAALMCVMGAAVALVVISQIGTGISAGPWRTAFGVLLATATAVMFAARPAAAVVYGQRASTAGHGPTTPDDPRVLWWVIAATAVPVVPASMLLAVFAVFAGGPLAGAAAHGAVAGAVASVAMCGLRIASVAARDTRINGLLYLTPMLAALWVWSAGGQIARPGLYGAATAVIVVLNIVIAAENPPSPRRR